MFKRGSSSLYLLIKKGRHELPAPANTQRDKSEADSVHSSCDIDSSLLQVVSIALCIQIGDRLTVVVHEGHEVRVLDGSTLYRRDYALFYPAAYWSFCLLMITADIFYKHYRIQQEQSEKEMEREVHATICEARQLMVSSVAAISQMIDEKDRYTSEHSHRVAEYARLIGAHMGFAGKELDSLYRSALLHDIGKIAVPDAILNKPSRLTDEEFDIMKQHTVWGRKILEGLEFLPQADCGASYHHERFDGKGYPAGLKGGQLPEMVWIISVADALDAMGSDRCYRGHCDRDYIIGEFRKLSGTQFEPAAVKAVVELLESGEIAVQ